VEWLLIVLVLVHASGLAAPLQPADGGAAAGVVAEPSPAPVGPSSSRLRAWGLNVAGVVGLLAGLYVALIFLLLVLEPRFIYCPSRQPQGDWTPPRGAQDCTIRTADGLELHGWWQPAHGAAPVLLWFHGNAGNVTYCAEMLGLLRGSGLSVLLVDYRGYGKSQGRPSEQGLYLDGKAAYRYLVEERGIEPGQIVSYGHSLGSAVALHVALERPVAALILESPLASARAMARRIMPWVPVWPFVRSRLDNVGRIEHLKVPLLVIHGDRDGTVPLEQGRAVFEAAPGPKRFFTVRGADHNDSYLVGGRVYFDELIGFCRQCTGRTHRD